MRDLSQEDSAPPVGLHVASTDWSDYLALCVSSVVSWIESMLAGALAGATAKSVIAPGDRVKIIFQADSQRKFSLSAAMKVASKIVEHSGIRGLWTGHGATLLRIMPYSATSYTTYDSYASLTKRVFGVTNASADRHSAENKDARAVAARFFAGSAAGATATVIVYPLDLIRARYAAHWDVTKRYPSYLGAVKSIIRDEGAGALYCGLRPALIGIIPYAGITFATFETLKATLVGRWGLKSEKDLHPTHSFLCGAVAGLTGQSLTYPLDIVRRRMQIHPLQYPTMTGAFAQIVKTEGIVGGLFKGLSMNWIKGPIAVGVSFATRDYFKLRIKDYHTTSAAKPPNHDPDVLEKLLCGAVAGGCAKLWTLPFDRMRIMFTVGLLQVDEHASRIQQIPATVRRMLRDSPNMWQGSGAMMLRVVPYAALSYTTFGAFQRIAERVTYASNPTQRILSDALAGAAATSFATCCLYPVDLLHTRTVARGMSGASYLDALRNMRRSGFPHLYHGVRASVFGVAPLGGISFAVYRAGCAQTGAESFVPQMVIGTLAGAAAQVVTYPLNVARRTVQVEEVEAGIVRHLSKLYRVNGLFSGLYRRMPLGWVLSPTTIGMSFAINDAMLRTMKIVREGNIKVHAVLSHDEFS